MESCCLASIRAYLKKPRETAICDGCGRLLLAYGNERDFQEAQKALSDQGLEFEVERHGSLHILIKPRQKIGG
jgi:hypothetical protein